MNKKEETSEEFSKALKRLKKTHPVLAEIYEEYKTFTDISNEYLELNRPEIYISSSSSSSSPI